MYIGIAGFYKTLYHPNIITPVMMKKNGFVLHQQKDDMGLEDPYTPEQVTYKIKDKTHQIVKIAYQQITLFR